MTSVSSSAKDAPDFPLPASLLSRVAFPESLLAFRLSTMPLLAVDLTRESRGHTHFIRCCVVLIAFSILFSATQGKDIKVGGNAGWAHTASYTDLEAVVGDRLVSLSALVHV